MRLHVWLRDPAMTVNPAVSIVWRAIIASSSVGVTNTGMRDWGAEMTGSLRRIGRRVER